MIVEIAARHWLFWLYVVLAGCASYPETIPIDYQLVDNPAKRRIELSWRNTSNKTVCLEPALWPNQAGKIDQAQDYLFLIIGEERFPIENFNTGFCLGGCPTYVEAGERTEAFLTYADFHLPERLISQPKALEFSPSGYVCRKP